MALIPLSQADPQAYQSWLQTQGGNSTADSTPSPTAAPTAVPTTAPTVAPTASPTPKPSLKTYTITDKQTGKTTTFKQANSPSQDQIDKAFATPLSGQIANGVTNAIRDINPLTNPNTFNALKFLFPHAAGAVEDGASGKINVTQPSQGSVPASQRKGNIVKTVQGGLQDTGNFATKTIPGGIELGVGMASGDIGGAIGSKIVSPIAGGVASALGKTFSKSETVLPAFLSKVGVANKTTQLASSATDSGISKVWSNVSKKATDSILSKFGDNAEVRSALNKTITENAPSKGPGVNPENLATGKPASFTGETDSATPSDLLNMRRQITARNGQTAFQKIFQGSNLQDKVDNEFRRVVSEELKSSVPAIKKYDALYSAYSKVGDVPTIGRRLAGAAVIDKLLGNKLGGGVREMGDLGAAVAAGLL